MFQFNVFTEFDVSSPLYFVRPYSCAPACGHKNSYSTALNVHKMTNLAYNYVTICHTTAAIMSPSVSSSILENSYLQLPHNLVFFCIIWIRLLFSCIRLFGGLVDLLRVKSSMIWPMSSFSLIPPFWNPEKTTSFMLKCFNIPTLLHLSSIACMTFEMNLQQNFSSVSPTLLDPLAGTMKCHLDDLVIDENCFPGKA